MKLINKYQDPPYGIRRVPVTYDEIVDAAEKEAAKRKQKEAAREHALTVGLDRSKPEIKAENTQSSDKTTTIVDNYPDVQEVNPHIGWLHYDTALGERMWQREHPYLSQWRNVATAAPFVIPLGIMLGGGIAGAIGSGLGRAAATNIGRMALDKGLQIASNRFISPVLDWGGKALKWGIRGLDGFFLADAANDINNGKFTPMNALELLPALHYGSKGIQALDAMSRIRRNPSNAFALSPESLASLPNRTIRGLPEIVRNQLFLDTGNGYVPYGQLTLGDLARNRHLDQILSTNNRELKQFIRSEAGNTRLYDDVPYLENWKKMLNYANLNQPYSHGYMGLVPSQYRPVLDAFDSTPITNILGESDRGFRNYLYPYQAERLDVAEVLRGRGVPSNELAALDTKLGYRRIPLSSDNFRLGQLSIKLDDIDYPWQIDTYVPAHQVDDVLNKFGKEAALKNGLVFQSKTPVYSAKDLTSITPEHAALFASRAPEHGSGASRYLDTWVRVNYNRPENAAVFYYLNQLAQTRDPKLRRYVSKAMFDRLNNRTMSGNLYASHDYDLSIDSYPIAIERILRWVAENKARWLSPTERGLVGGLSTDYQILNNLGLSGRFRGDIPFDPAVKADQIVSADEIAKAFGLGNSSGVIPRYAEAKDVDALYKMGFQGPGYQFMTGTTAPNLRSIVGKDGSISIVGKDGIIYKRYQKPYSDTEIVDNLNKQLMDAIQKYNLDDAGHTLFNQLKASSFGPGKIKVGTFGIQSFKQGAKLIPRRLKL